MLRRQEDSAAAPRCQRGGVADDFDTGLHVVALFVVLATSFLACAFPLLVIRFPRLRIPTTVLFIVRHVGTGVLLATAFVHLLPTAFISLGDPCLSEFWTDDYPSMPGAIALMAVFMIAGIEMAFSPDRRCCRDDSGVTTVVQRAPSAGCRPAGGEDCCDPVPDPPPSAQEFDPDAKIQLSAEQQHQKMLMQVMLLEMGILFHSVFIGLNLSVSSGKDFIVLWVAIVFHQFFEGLALGSRIAALEWRSKDIKPWLMCFAYGCTTPIGQAIGLGLHHSYSPESESGLLLVGIMNGISAGLLIYTSLIGLLGDDFLSDRSWRLLRGVRRVAACSFVILGAIGMSIVGAWA